MDPDLDTLATALYVPADELAKHRPDLLPWRPRIGTTPQISDAELVTLAVMAAVLRIPSEARWLRYARAHLRHYVTCSPICPSRAGTTSGCDAWAG